MKSKLATQRKLKNAFATTVGNFLSLPYFFILIAFAVSIAWIPDGLGSFLSKIFPEEYVPYIQLGTGFFILSMLFIIGKIYSEKKLPKLEPYQSFPDKKKNLILFLSPLYKSSSELLQIKSFEDFEKRKIPWQMPSVAVKYHLPVLKNVFVILSSESKKQFKDFEKFINQLFPEANIKLIPIGLDDEINFEDFEQVNNILEKVYNDLKQKYNAKDRETILDITGGQKVVSIVGAMNTLTANREFQYVSTSNYEVKSFDVRYYEE